MDGWTVTNVKSPLIRKVGNLINVYIGDIGTGTDPNQAIYWEAPAAYLGNKVTSSQSILSILHPVFVKFFLQIRG